jgi:hypothetical protein
MMNVDAQWREMVIVSWPILLYLSIWRGGASLHAVAAALLFVNGVFKKVVFWSWFWVSLFPTSRDGSASMKTPKSVITEHQNNKHQTYSASMRKRVFWGYKMSLNDVPLDGVNMQSLQWTHDATVIPKLQAKKKSPGFTFRLSQLLLCQREACMTPNQSRACELKRTQEPEFFRQATMPLRDINTALLEYPVPRGLDDDRIQILHPSPTRDPQRDLQTPFRFQQRDRDQLTPESPQKTPSSTGLHSTSTGQQADQCRSEDNFLLP